MILDPRFKALAYLSWGSTRKDECDELLVYVKSEGTSHCDGEI